MNPEEKLYDIIRDLCDFRREVSEEDWAAFVDELENFLDYTAEEFEEFEAECRKQYYE